MDLEKLKHFEIWFNYQFGFLFTNGNNWERLIDYEIEFIKLKLGLV